VITGVGLRPTDPVTQTGLYEGAATIRPVLPDTLTFGLVLTLADRVRPETPTLPVTGSGVGVISTPEVPR